jgi:hypothetical protein
MVRPPVEEEPNKSSINCSFASERSNWPVAAEECCSGDGVWKEESIEKI